MPGAGSAPAISVIRLRPAPARSLLSEEQRVRWGVRRPLAPARRDLAGQLGFSGNSLSVGGEGDNETRKGMYPLALVSQIPLSLRLTAQ